jgi:hypothetical protein
MRIPGRMAAVSVAAVDDISAVGTKYPGRCSREREYRLCSAQPITIRSFADFKPGQS